MLKNPNAYVANKFTSVEVTQKAFNQHEAFLIL